jgi:hypothetical protein
MTMLLLRILLARVCSPGKRVVFGASFFQRDLHEYLLVAADLICH